jgi:hypothetical protein
VEFPECSLAAITLRSAPDPAALFPVSGRGCAFSAGNDLAFSFGRFFPAGFGWRGRFTAKFRRIQGDAD